MGISIITTMRVFLLLLFFFSYCLCEEEPLQTPKFQERNKKLFWVYTETTTSTVVTSSQCYLTVGALVACGRRKKRRSFIENGSNDLAYEISPDTMVEDDLMSSSKDPDQVTGEMRDGRLLLYWMTTTSVFTTSSFTDVQTVASITCTPNGFSMDDCLTLGKKKK